MTTYRDAAKASLETMVNVWKQGNAFRNCSGGGCFWMAGNFFHTAIDALYHLQLKDIFGFGADGLTFFDESAPQDPDPRKWPTASKIWVDDYGWWGIAFAFAYRYADVLGYDAPTKQAFAERAQKCWEAMNSSWQSSVIMWDVDAKSYSVSGGISNTTEEGVLLGGRNCVTNEVYWILSNVLSEAFGNHYNDPHASASELFVQGHRQKILFDSDGLVYERLYGMPGSGCRDWTWLGDQGLFAYALFFDVTGNKGVFGGDKALSVLESVMNTRKTANGILHEDPAPWLDFVMDYACGKGTFMRYLNYINSDLHHAVPGLSMFDEYIALNARSVWKNRFMATNQFGFYWGEEMAPFIDWRYGDATSNAVLHAAGFTAIIAALDKYADQPIG